MAFAATHVVPAPGLSTWPAPDPTVAPGPRLAAGLSVQVLETTPQGWAHVACANGWTAWVDARLLTAPPTHTKTELVRQAWRASVVLTPLALVGAAAMALASFLPWFSAGGESASGWDVGLHWVFFGTGDGTSGVQVGLPPLLGGAGAALLALARQRAPLPAVVGLAAMGSWTATLATARVLRPQPHPDLGIGVLLAFAGAAVVAVDAYQCVRREQAPR
jgi:hypothetical protein